MRQDSPALLQVENLAASYGKRQIVSGIGFSLSAGELCALIGLNGSGKTTLLKTVAGLLKADTGYPGAGRAAPGPADVIYPPAAQPNLGDDRPGGGPDGGKSLPGAFRFA